MYEIYFSECDCSLQGETELRGKKRSGQNSSTIQKIDDSARQPPFVQDTGYMVSVIFEPQTLLLAILL